MIKDSDNRLGKAVQELRELVVRLFFIFHLLFIDIVPDYAYYACFLLDTTQV